jgi:hypothetical protein
MTGCVMPIFPILGVSVDRVQSFSAKLPHGEGGLFHLSVIQTEGVFESCLPLVTP